MAQQCVMVVLSHLLSLSSLKHWKWRNSSPHAKNPVERLRKGFERALASPEVNTLDVQDSAVSPPVAAAGGLECWDEYITAIDAMSKSTGKDQSNVCLIPPNSTTQTDMSFPGQQPIQPGYHFAVGPGLAKEIQCPLWQYPMLSYYPTMQHSPSFEVMWRVWEEIEDSSASTPPLVPFPYKKSEFRFTVMSYNILSQDLLEANQDLYTHCPLEVLEWSYRSRLLLEEIQKWAPDILCLQEVQENHFYQQLHPVLTQMGYSCVYKRRTGTKTDGCATCYRSSCFAELSVIEVEYFRPDIEVLDRHNVAIILLLRPLIIEESEVKAQGPPLCVANTHLLFNPRRVVHSCKRNGEHCNIILCGDFNSVPYTPLYQLITKGELYFQGLPAWVISGQEDLSYKSHFYKLHAPLWPNTVGITDCCRYLQFRQFLSHRLDLQSVYKHVLPGSGNAEVTTLHSQVGATVDYIFYSPKLTSNTESKDRPAL
ncbi:hypothetical protein WMY93_016476 [Mugilogobius chulae]|uniref:Endonuclease/exonuclease/phosphatase domain-containing protein n=1 Tax=Mugilogobius chulae TaxID=88201 RepID=A0AAW0NPR5_9GOBI